MRIYLCDDNPQYRHLTRLVLAEHHEIVGESGDGDEAVRDASDVRPDLILLDLNMPRMPGYEALGPLRAALPDAKIVILTSGRADDERARAISRRRRLHRQAGEHLRLARRDRSGTRRTFAVAT